MSQEKFNNKPNITEALALSDQYGGIDKIPDEELLSIGYVRPEPDNRRYIAPLELIRSKAEEAKREKSFTWEEKINNKPFGRLEVPLISKKNVAFRRIANESFDRLFSIANEIGELEYPDSSEKKLNDNLTTFANEYYKVYDSLYPQLPLNSNFIFDFCLLPFFEKSLEKSSLRHADGYLFSFAISDEEEVIASPESRDMFYSLEKQKGVLTDLSILKSAFNESLLSVPWENKHLIGYEKAHIQNKCQENNLNTCFDAVKYSFAAFLKFKDFEQLSKDIKKSDDLDSIKNLLESSRSHLFDDLIIQEKSLRLELKETPRSDIDKLKVLNSKLKEIEDTKKDRRKVIDGMIAYFSAPELTAQFFARKIKSMQDILTGTSIKENEQIKLYLDATPDADYDKDPGKVSGDCTIGKPLPFNNPEFPVYNVKVFDNNNEHIGNMYLLVTYEADVKNTVWHFDAIQIPDSRIDWNIAIENVIQTIAAEAMKKDVSYITVNSESPLISNYDYISDAVERYHTEQRKGDIGIYTPKADTNYSDLQANGLAKVLWKNDNRAVLPQEDMHGNQDID